MKVEDESVQYKEQKQILRNEFSNLLRYGRSGVYAIVDTQSPKEVRNITPGQEGMICLNRLPGEADREAVCDRPKRDGKLNSVHIAYIGTMPIQEMAVLEQGKTSIKKIDYVQPPKSMGWKPETGKFINVWKSKYNTYDTEINSVKKDIENLNKFRKPLNTNPDESDDGMDFDDTEDNEKGSEKTLDEDEENNKEESDKNETKENKEVKNKENIEKKTKEKDINNIKPTKKTVSQLLENYT